MRTKTPQPLQYLHKFCDALSSNVGIAVIRLETTIEIGDSGCLALADAALNRHVHELSVKGVKGTSIPVFLDRLMPQLGDNFNLLLLNIPVCVKPNDRMREAQDIVRRNCGIADRATRFVMEDLSPCCARAFEIVSEEPVLVHAARRSLSENATAKILQSPEVSSRPRRAHVHETGRSRPGTRRMQPPRGRSPPVGQAILRLVVVRSSVPEVRRRRAPLNVSHEAFLQVCAFFSTPNNPILPRLPGNKQLLLL
ncbi:hypothetical protein MTO96_026447 [Rhipicephalus appendiculatus]